MKRARPPDVERAVRVPPECEEGPLATLPEFWQAMLRPLLPLYMRLRCQRLSRLHHVLFHEEPWPPWVTQERARGSAAVRRNLVELGIACGFPPAPLATDALNGRFCWETHDGARHLTLTLDLEHLTVDRRRSEPGARTVSLERLAIRHARRPRVEMLPAPLASVTALDRAIRKAGLAKLRAAGVEVTLE